MLTSQRRGWAEATGAVFVRVLCVAGRVICVAIHVYMWCTCIFVCGCLLGIQAQPSYGLGLRTWSRSSLSRAVASGTMHFSQQQPV